MQSVIQMLFGYSLLLASCAVAQSEGRTASPWHASADELPVLPHRIDVELEIAPQVIEAYETVIARVTLTNMTALNRLKKPRIARR